MIIIIAAIGSNNIIGDGTGLPWHIPEEYNMFLGHIRGQTVIMGRRSWEIFSNDMLPRRMVVVSGTLQTDRATVFGSLEEALHHAGSYREDIYICGGQAIYEESLGYADYMYLSFVKGEHRGNVYFPEFDRDEWTVERSEEHDDFNFIVYSKRRKAVRG